MRLPHDAKTDIHLHLEDVETRTVNSYGEIEPMTSREASVESRSLVSELTQSLGEPHVTFDNVGLTNQRGFGGHEILEVARHVAFALGTETLLQGTFDVIRRWLTLGDRRKVTLRWSTGQGETQLDLSDFTEAGAIEVVRLLTERGPAAPNVAPAAPPAPKSEPAPVHGLWDIYLSHAHKDAARSARELHDHLRRLKSDVTVFLDALVLRLGDDWDLALKAALEASRLVAVLVSPATEQAYYQREEVSVAVARGRKNPDVLVIPIYLDPRTSASPPFGLGLKHAIDVKQAGGLEAVAKELLRL